MKTDRKSVFFYREDYLLSQLDVKGVVEGLEMVIRGDGVNERQLKFFKWT
jgi:hypothetical protein